MEKRFAELMRDIREAVIDSAQKQANNDGEINNGCVRILVVARCEEASSWMFLPLGRNRYEEATPIITEDDMITPSQEDESLEIDHSVIAAMKIAHCMKAQRMKKGDISGLELSDDDDMSAENMCGYAPLRGAICIKVTHGFEADVYDKPFLDIYVGVSNSGEIEDQNCATAAFPVIDRFFIKELDRGNWPFYIKNPDLCMSEVLTTI